MADPIGIPQEVRASPPNPSSAAAQGAGQIAVPHPLRASHVLPPKNNRQAVAWSTPFPVASVLQGLGSTLINPVNPASIVTRPMNGLSAASNIDTSVSAQARAKRAIMGTGGPIVGDYTDAIRNAAGFAFGPPRMPGQGYMASSYSYPSQAMVIGAALAGTDPVTIQPLNGNPMVNPQPVMAAPMATAPRLVTRSHGQGPRGQISTSPSEDRRRMLSTLQGLGALGAAERVAEGTAQAAYCNKTYPKGQGSAEQDRYNDLCKIVMWPINFDPWTQAGKAGRDLPINWTSLIKDVTGLVKGPTGDATTQPVVCPPGQVYNAVTRQCAAPQSSTNTGLIIGGLAAAAAVGFVLMSRK